MSPSAALRPGLGYRVGLLLLIALSFWISLWAALVALFRFDGLTELVGAWRWLVVPALFAGAAASALGLGQQIAAWACGEAPQSSGRPFRLLLYCVVVGLALYFAFGQPFDPLGFDIAIGLCASLFAGLWLLLRRFDARAPKMLVALDITLLNLSLVVVAAAVGLEIVAAVRPSVLFHRPAAGVAERVERARWPAGKMHMGYPVNSGGHYDAEFLPKRPGRSLVLSIGDSFSIGVVPQPYHFTSVAERLLSESEGSDVVVANMGLPAIGPPEYLHLLMTEGMILDPDVIVVNLYLGNDFSDRLPIADPHEGLRRWFDRDNLLLYQVPRRLGMLSRERAELAAEIEAVGDTAAEAPAPGMSDEELHPWVSDPLLEKPTFTVRRFFEVEVRRAEAIADQSIDEFKQRFEILGEIRRAAGDIPLVFLVIPEEFQIEDELWQQIEKFAGRSLDRDRVWRLLVGWLEQEGLPYCDLLPALLEAPTHEDGSRHLYHARDTHFNAAGNKVAGQAMAQCLTGYL